MIVLYHPQLSMRSYRDNRWLFWSDAQVTKMRAYMEHLPEDWQWYWLVPPLGQLGVGDKKDGMTVEVSQAMEWFEQWTEMVPAGTASVHVPWMYNVLQGRYYFPMHELIRLVEKLRDSNQVPDVLLLEVPEHARAWRAVQQWTGCHFPIISMVEHVDLYEQTKVPEEIAYHLRQVDGAMVSDRLAFPLQGMYEEWHKAAGDAISMQSLTTLHRNVGVSIWNAIYASDEVQEYKDLAAQGHVPIINFISRLSDNQRTHYEEFAEATNILRDQGVEFETWVMNPNEAKERSWIFETFANVGVAGPPGLYVKQRPWYLAGLWQSDIVPILYPQSHIYSLGFCEAIEANNLILTEYVEGYETDNLRAIGVDPKDPQDIAEKLKQAIEMEGQTRWEVLEYQKDWLRRNRSVEMNIGRVQATIEEVAGVRDV
jgi:hypothetical protein